MSLVELSLNDVPQHQKQVKIISPGAVG